MTTTTRKQIRARAIAHVLAGLIAACGAGIGSARAAGPAAPGGIAPPAGGLYVGFYQEDPITNPEDPTPGAFSLNLPAGNGSFEGSMFFTYVGCQSSNVGSVSGTKTDLALSGSWSGTVDGSAQAGTYAGRYDAANQFYAGTFVNAGGKQFRDLRPCIQYTIAPNGTFEMFAVESHNPATFTVSVASRSIGWGAVSGASTALVYVLDPAIAITKGNPVVWQTVVGAGTTTRVPGTSVLTSRKAYIAVVAVLNARHQRIAFSSQRFTAP